MSYRPPTRAASITNNAVITVQTLEDRTSRVPAERDVPGGRAAPATQGAVAASAPSTPVVNFNCPELRVDAPSYPEGSTIAVTINGTTTTEPMLPVGNFHKSYYWTNPAQPNWRVAIAGPNGTFPFEKSGTASGCTPATSSTLAPTPVSPVESDGGAGGLSCWCGNRSDGDARDTVRMESHTRWRRAVPTTAR